MEDWKLCSLSSEQKLQSLKEVKVLTFPLCDESQGVVSEKARDGFYGKLIATIFSMESQWLRTSNVVEKRPAVPGDLEATRNCHLHQLKERKHRVVDFVEVAYQQLELLTKNAYLDIEGDNDAASASSMAFGFLGFPNCVRHLDESADNCKILNQPSIFRKRLAAFSVELDTLSIHLGTAITADDINMPMPEDLRKVLIKLTTVPLPLSALPYPSDVAHQHERPLSFSTSSTTIQLPGISRTLALLSDKSLLLAELEHGMSEVRSENGRKFSRWLPPVYDVTDDKYFDGSFEDSVTAVVALSDGRAAVGLAYKQVVVLLRRCKKADYELDECEENFAWTEYRRLDPLDFLPQILSSHGDVLAAGTLQCRDIQLMSVRSGRHLGPAMINEYPIKSLAVCSKALITGSCDKLDLGGGHLAYVIDAHSLKNHDELLWRHKLSCDEELKALCADSIGGWLYVAVSDRCSARVAAIRLEDGEASRNFLTLDETPQTPLLLSALSIWNDAATDQQKPLQKQSGASFSRPVLLTVLYSDPKKVIKSKVNVHRSSRKC